MEFPGEIAFWMSIPIFLARLAIYKISAGLPSFRNRLERDFFMGFDRAQRVNLVTMLLNQPGPQFKLPSLYNKAIYAISV